MLQPNGNMPKEAAAKIERLQQLLLKREQDHLVYAESIKQEQYAEVARARDMAAENSQEALRM